MCSPSDKIKKKAYRRAHKKSHLGCSNCKYRRIKCNEQLPVCGQCSKSKLSCSYLQLSREEIDLRTLSQHKQQQEDHYTQPASAAAVGGTNTNTPPSGGGTPSDSHTPNNSRYNVEPPVISLPPITGKYSHEKLPSLNQSVVLPALNNSLVSPTPNPLVRQGFETDMIRGAYMEWLSLLMKDAYRYPPLYHAVMAFSLGFLSLSESSSTDDSQRQRHAVESGKHRFIAIHELQEELGKENVEQVDPLLACSLILSWDAFFQQDNYESYATLAKGLAAVLEKVHLMDSTTQAAACMTDALFQGIKAVQMPPYQPTFLTELCEKVQQLRPKFEHDCKLRRQCDNLIEYTNQVMDFVHRNPVRQSMSTKSGATYHSPRTMFYFVRRWMQIFPSEAMAVKEPLLLYVYYHAVTRALDALFPEARYLFQFGFIGPVDLAGIENRLGNRNCDPEFIYPLKVLGFFKERLFLLNRLLIAKDPLKVSSSDSDKILEEPITRFENKSIAAEHYPSISNEMSPPSLTNSPSGEPSMSTSTSPSSGTSSSNGEYNEPPPDETRSQDIFKNYFHDRMEILFNCI